MLQFSAPRLGHTQYVAAIQQMWNTLRLNWRWFFVTQIVKGFMIGAFRPRSAKVVSNSAM